MRTRVICMGNEMVCDDGVGIRVGRVLQKLDLPSDTSIELRPRVGLELLDTMQSDEHLVLVDASATGKAAGVCSLIPSEEAEALAHAPYCCHVMGIPEVLELGRRLQPERLPARVSIVGIEAKVTDRFGTTLSDEVREGLPDAVVRVLEVMGLPTSIQARGRSEAERAKAWDPPPHEALGG